MPLSEKQMTYLALAWQCFDTEPKIDYARLATLASLASAASARELVRQAKKKLKDEHGVTVSAEKKVGNNNEEDDKVDAAEVERDSIVVGINSPQTPRGSGGGGMKRKGRGGGAAGGGAKGSARKLGCDDAAALFVTANNNEGEAETPTGKKMMSTPKKRGMGKKVGGAGGRKRKNQGDGEKVGTVKKIKTGQGDDEDETMGNWVEGVEAELTDGEMAF